MADISNKLNKASEDLAGTFVEIKENTTDFGVALTEATSKMADFTEQYVKAVDGLGDKTKGIAETLKQIFSKAGGAFKKIPGLTKLAALGPLGAITGAATLLFKQLLQVSDTISQISKDTGLVGKQLKGLFKETKLAAGGLAAFGMSLSEVGKQAAALHESMGGTVGVSNKLITVTSKIQKAMGGSAQEAANLATNLIRGFGKTEKQVEQFTESMMTFATTHGINARRVMRDISNDSNLTSIYLSRGEDYLKRSVLLAGKMGKSLADVTATTDAFNTFENAADITARLNQGFGGNLNAMKMYNNYVKGDMISTHKELNKLFSSPRGQEMMKNQIGWAKELGALVGLTVADMRNFPEYMANYEKSLRGPTKEQMDLNKFIMEGMKLWEQLQGVVSAALLPLFSEFGSIIHHQIKPLMNEASVMAESFGKAISASMDSAKGLGPKLRAAWETIKVHLVPVFNRMGEAIGNAFMRGVAKWFENSTLGRVVRGMFVGAAGGAARGAIGGPKGALIGGGIGAIVGGIGGYMSAPSVNATGQVHSSPTLALVGEENRSEVVVPTERIRKGLPVSGSVARELSSIGVPGFAFGHAGPSAAAVAAHTSATNRRSRENMLYGSQGDPNAIKRREQLIAQQAREDRAAQAALVEKILDKTLEGAGAEYFGGSHLGGDRDPYRDGGDPPRGPGERGKGPRTWEKRIHEWSKTLDHFMKLTHTTWKDLLNALPDKIEKPITKMFTKLPEALRTGLTTGTEAAWDHWLETGKFEDAMIKGLAVGIKNGMAGNGEFQAALGNVLSAHVEGKSWRKALGEEFTNSLNTPGGTLYHGFETFNDKANDLAWASKKENQITQDMLKVINSDYDLAKKRYDSEVIWNGVDSPQAKAAQADMDMNRQLAKQVSRDNQKHQLRLARDQALYGGGAAALESGVNTFAATGSFKEAGKSALASGVGAGVTYGASAALSPFLGPAAPFAGAILGSIAEWGVGELLGGGKDKATGAMARAKVTGGLSGAIRMARKPGGNQLYEMFKAGTSGNDMAKEYIDAAMLNSQGQPDEGLRQELINAIGAVVQRSTGVQFSTPEILTLLSGMKGTGMQNFEQKNLLTSYERRIEGVGARGAIVNRPTVALIGEAGPEAVTPLDQTPGNAPLGSGGDLAAEIRQMNGLLKQIVTNPPPVNLDGQRVSKVLNAVNSDDIRTGVSTVNSRI